MSPHFERFVRMQVSLAQLSTTGIARGVVSPSAR